MEEGPPHPLGRESLRTFERLRPTLAVEDRDGGRVPLDLGDVVCHDEVDVRLFHERHRPGLQFRFADARFRLEANQGLLRAFAEPIEDLRRRLQVQTDRKSTRLNSSHDQISYAVFCLKKKKKIKKRRD